MSRRIVRRAVLWPFWSLSLVQCADGMETSMSCSKSLRGVEVLDSLTRQPVGNVSVLYGHWRVGVGAWMISNWPSADLRSNGGKWGGVVSELIGISIRRGPSCGVIALMRPDHIPPPAPGADCDVGVGMLFGKRE